MKFNPRESIYIVVCVYRDDGTTRVVGPFAAQQSAVDWAYEMRSANRSWDYRPDVMQPPPVERDGHA